MQKITKIGIGNSEVVSKLSQHFGYDKKAQIGETPPHPSTDDQTQPLGPYAIKAATKAIPHLDYAKEKFQMIISGKFKTVSDLTKSGLLDDLAAIKAYLYNDILDY